MTDKIKVIQAVGPKGPGGAETFFVRLVKAMDKDNRFEVTPLVRPESWVGDELAKVGIKVKTAPFSGIFDFKTKGIFKKLAKENNIDIIQTWMSRASKHAPKIEGVKLMARMGGYYKLKYYQKCDYIAGNTKALLEYFKEEGWPADRSTYLPNFAEEPSDSYSNMSVKEARAHYGLPDDARVVMVAARLHVVKACDTAIKAISQLPEDVHIIFAGIGPDKQMLKDLSKKLGIENRVHFPGWESDISRMAKASDLWLVPSRHETLGNVVLEAFMHQMPCVATKSFGPASLINSGDNGLLVEIDEPDEMAEAIKKVLDDKKLAAKLAAAGRKYADDNFSAEIVLNQYYDFYKKC